MNAITYIYHCANCGREFSAPGVPEFSYGMFVMRSEKSDYAAFLHAIGDSAFLEIQQMISEYTEIVRLKDREKAKLMHEIFGLICDEAPDGSKLLMDAAPICPSCGSREMKSWKQVHPAQIWPLPTVEHKKWDSKSHAEKLAAIDKAIKQII
jgi:DNA-directed RNA polymerase subunit RPC12/RpoP